MHFRSLTLLALFAICTGLFGVGSQVAAQDTTATPAQASDGYPVAIHAGSCDNPTAEPAWQVSTTSGIAPDDNGIVGTPTGLAVYEATGAVDAKLDDLGKEPYVIALHASAQDYNTIVACGSIAGPKKDGKLIIALEPVGDAKVTGFAILDEDSSGVLGLGGDKVQVTVYVTDGSSSSPSTPAA